MAAAARERSGAALERAARGRLRKALVVLAGFLLLIVGALWFTARTSATAQATARAVLAAPDVAQRVGGQQYAVLLFVDMASAGTRLCSVHDYWVVGARRSEIVSVIARGVNFGTAPPQVTVLPPGAPRPSAKSCTGS